MAESIEPRETQADLCVAVFVLNDRDRPQCIIRLREDPHQAPEKTWALPDGYLEPDETFEQCAERVVREDARLEIEDVRYLTTVDTTWKDKGQREVTIFMTAVTKFSCGPSSWMWRTLSEVWGMGTYGENKVFRPINSLFEQRLESCTAIEPGFELPNEHEIRKMRLRLLAAGQEGSPGNAAEDEDTLLQAYLGASASDDESEILENFMRK